MTVSDKLVNNQALIQFAKSIFGVYLQNGQIYCNARNLKVLETFMILKMRQNIKVCHILVKFNEKTYFVATIARIHRSCKLQMRPAGSSIFSGLHFTINYASIFPFTIDMMNLRSICWFLEFRARSYHTIPYHTIPYHTIPYHTIPYHTIQYHINHIISYHNISIISYHIISYQSYHIS